MSSTFDFKKTNLIFGFTGLSLLAIFAAIKPLFCLTIIAGLIGGFLLLKKPSIWLPLVLVFSIIGELYRLPFGSNSGLLLNDVFIPLLALIWIIKKILGDRQFKKLDVFLPLLVFISIAILSFVHGLSFLRDTSEIINSGFYLFRFIAYAFLIPITSDIINTEAKKWKLIKAIIVASVILSLAGFMQLILVNDFGGMAKKYGWDPHIGRLLSTWFDPNFIGGFFALILSIIIGLILYEKSGRRRFWLIISTFILLAGLALTYSRSSYLAFAFSLFMIGLLRSRKLIVVGFLISVLLLTVSDRAQRRVVDMYYSGLSVLGVIETENPDPTARLRVESWRQNIDIAKNHWLIGVGYNTLRYVKLNEGYVKDINEHSASGSDSSLLTILATTGVFGLISFMWLYLVILKNAVLRWQNKNGSELGHGLGLGFFAGLLSLFLIHALFVNSLLFFPIVIYVWLFSGLTTESTSAKAG